jgi:hypothetical protein
VEEEYSIDSCSNEESSRKEEALEVWTMGFHYTRECVRKEEALEGWSVDF